MKASASLGRKCTQKRLTASTFSSAEGEERPFPLSYPCGMWEEKRRKANILYRERAEGWVSSWLCWAVVTGPLAPFGGLIFFLETLAFIPKRPSDLVSRQVPWYVLATMCSRTWHPFLLILVWPSL